MSSIVARSDTNAIPLLAGGFRLAINADSDSTATAALRAPGRSRKRSRLTVDSRWHSNHSVDHPSAVAD
jgi:hypothetical protein